MSCSFLIAPLQLVLRVLHSGLRVGSFPPWRAGQLISMLHYCLWRERCFPFSLVLLASPRSSAPLSHAGLMINVCTAL